MGTKPRIVIAVICAACVGIAFAAFADEVRSEADRQRSEAMARYGGEVVNLVVARHALEPGDVVEAGDVETREWLADLAPEGAVTQEEDVIGTQVTVPAAGGAPLTKLNFRDATEQQDVPSGHIAVSVPVTDRLGLSQGTLSGSSVIAYRVGDDGSHVIATDVVVLSMPEASSAGLGTQGTLSLGVLPEDVSEILSASAADELRIVLPADDVEAIPDEGTPSAPDEVAAETADVTGESA